MEDERLEGARAHVRQPPLLLSAPPQHPARAPSPPHTQTYSAEVIAVYSSGAGSTGMYTSREQAYQITSASGPTGLYIYFDITSPTQIATVNAGDRYFLNVTFNDGVRFIPDDANTAHQPFECSGRGVCDRALGACNCVAGYSGDACQRTVCPGDCSGNGICQSEAYFVQDASTASGQSLTYTGFDANSAYGCKCDAGFRGPDCSARECPSGPDPMNGDGGAQGMDCSGRGLCDYTTGTCRCFRGFFGERCEVRLRVRAAARVRALLAYRPPPPPACAGAQHADLRSSGRAGGGGGGGAAVSALGGLEPRWLGRGGCQGCAWGVRVTKMMEPGFTCVYIAEHIPWSLAAA